MAQAEHAPAVPASLEEIQREWSELKSRVGQVEAERAALESENKNLRFLIERAIEHRQKSHGELILLLTSLVSKLPINDVGLIVSRLVEHNANVSEMCAALAKGNAESTLPQPAILKAIEDTRRDLAAAAKTAVEELIQMDTPLDTPTLRSVLAQPDTFLSPPVVRATRCFIKGQLPRERVVKEFGEEAVALFADMTTDPKLNPRPKPEEIVLGFKPDFAAALQQSALAPEKKQALGALHQKVQRSRAPTADARAQKNAFYRLSVLLELLHYYENQNTEAPDAIFAQRMPGMVEQLIVTSAVDPLDEKLVAQGESLLALILNPDHRLMVINNMGKAGAAWRTLKFILRIRAEKSPESNDTLRNEIIPEFVKHLIPPPPQKPPLPQIFAATLRLLSPPAQKMVVQAVMESDRLRREEAHALGLAIGKELNLTGLQVEAKNQALSPEIERKMAWEKIQDLLSGRAEPTAIAAAVRDRLHAKYDADEVKQSWITLTEADPILFIRTFCQLPYLADGTTDAMARTVMETYVTRLMHEKYAATYHKILNSLKNMFKANPGSPTLVNFVTLVKWIDASAAARLSADIGMPA